MLKDGGQPGLLLASFPVARRLRAIPFMLATVIFGRAASALIMLGPDRESPRWQWVSVGGPDAEDHGPPRREDEMSLLEARLADRASPEGARSLFTVRAAISAARLVLWPRFFTLDLMCSYCRSRLGPDPRGNSATSGLP